MQLLGSLVIAGFGLIHFGLGVLLLITGYRALRNEIAPRLRIDRSGPVDATLSVLGGVGWTIAVALFCFLVASRAAQMVL